MTTKRKSILFNGDNEEHVKRWKYDWEGVCGWSAPKVEVEWGEEEGSTVNVTMPIMEGILNPQGRIMACIPRPYGFLCMYQCGEHVKDFEIRLYDYNDWDNFLAQLEKFLLAEAEHLVETYGK